MLRIGEFAALSSISIQISAINTVVAEWLEKNRLEINGEIFSIYHSSPGNCSNDKAFVTELCFPVKEKV